MTDTKFSGLHSAAQPHATSGRLILRAITFGIMLPRQLLEIDAATRLRSVQQSKYVVSRDCPLSNEGRQGLR